MSPPTVEERVADLLEEVLDLVLVNHIDAVAEETFTACKLCGEWEDHKQTCLVPHIERWLSGL